MPPLQQGGCCSITSHITFLMSHPGVRWPDHKPSRQAQPSAALMYPAHLHTPNVFPGSTSPASTLLSAQCPICNPNSPPLWADTDNTAVLPGPHAKGVAQSRRKGGALALQGRGYKEPL